MSSKGNGKRPAQEQANLTGRAKRRAKSRESRKIGNNTREFENVLAKDAPRISGNLNATDFVAARLQEVKAMQSAIKSASNALNSLTFQSLPRHMRRRAASHNINRLPAHLRARAAREMEKSPPNKRKARRGKRPPKESNTALEFERRQKENKWLETHMWHTKRMQMSNIWGYRLATRPNIKSARSIYRSFQHLSVVHDASYMGCVELTGAMDDIVRVMDTVTDCSLPSVGSERYTKGNRAGKTFLYEYLGCPTKLICPLQFLWRPSKNDQERTMWLWIHPSCFAEAYNAIHVSLNEISLQESVKIRELRDAFSVFMLSGPRSTAILQAVLAPVEECSVTKDQDDSPTTKAAKVWRVLASLRSSSSLPPGAVIGLTVQDPRLKFPQKLAPRNGNSQDDDTSERLHDLLENWPDEISDSLIWDDDVRKHLNEHKLSDYQLTKRREQNLLPGTKLEFTEQDAQIPLLLLQRGSAENGLSRQDPCNSELFEGWTLIVPRGWGLSFWKSFMFAGARATGIEDVHAMHYESGQLCFPHDYIGTRACENIRTMKKTEEEAAWSRRPPAKRLNFAKLGIERPFEVAFDVLTNTPTTQQQEDTAMADNDDDEEKPRPEYYLVQHDTCISLVLQANTLTDAESAYQSHIASMYSKRNIAPPLYPPRLNVALFKIRLEYLDRGRPESNAMIYLISDQADYEKHTYYVRNRGPGFKSKRKVLSDLETGQDDQEEDIDDHQDGDGEEDEKMTDAKPRFPPSTDHIGFLTTGAFSFDAGCGVGVGACTVSGILRVKQLDAEHQRKLKMVVLVRNMKALQCRPAQLQVLS